MQAASCAYDLPSELNRRFFAAPDPGRVGASMKTFELCISSLTRHSFQKVSLS